MLVYDKEEPVTENLITWVFDENSFVPAAKLVGDKSYSILTDHLGTPYEAYDENGKRCGVLSMTSMVIYILLTVRKVLYHSATKGNMRMLKQGCITIVSVITRLIQVLILAKTR